MDKINIYAASDSVGETAEQVARAVMRQFDVAEFSVKRFSFINDKEAIDDLISKARQENAFIVFTLVVEELRDYLAQKAALYDIGAVDILTPVLLPLVKELGLSPKYEPGLLRKLDDKYFKKVEAVEFAVKYDDGKDTSRYSSDWSIKNI
jgi:regulator of PEP synthase PpsR (kinase-PPPase family)